MAKSLRKQFDQHVRAAHAALETCPRETLRQTALAAHLAEQIPVDGSALATLYWNRGAAYYSLGRHASALRAYRQALRLRPGDPDLLLSLAYSAEQLHRIDDALCYARRACEIATEADKRECLERMAWFQVMLADLDGARRTLLELLSLPYQEPSLYVCRLLLVVFRSHMIPKVVRFLQRSKLVRKTPTLHTQLAFSLGRGPQPDCPPPGVLHPILSSERRERIVLHPVIAGAGREFQSIFEASLDGLRSFHARQFGKRVEIAPMRYIDVNLSIHQLYEAIDVESYLQHLSRTSADDFVVVGIGGQSGSGPFGFTSGRVAVVCLPRLLYSETLLTHEFYHAALELEHTDGVAEVDDPLSVMAPLECLTYLAPSQRDACLTRASAYRQALRGQTLLQDGQYRKAVATLSRAVAADPRQRWAVLKLAEAWAHVGDMERVAEVLPHAPWARLALAHHTAGAGLPLDLSGLPPWHQAHVYFGCGRYPDALRAYRLEQGRGYAEDGILYCLLAMGRWGQARRQVHRLLSTSPWSWSLYARLAEIEAAEARPGPAREALQEARGRCPRAPRLWWHQASVHRLLGEWEAAARLLRQHDAWSDAGWCLWQAGRPPAAARAFEKAAAASPSQHFDSILAQQWLHYLRGQSVQARALVRRLPWSAPALSLLVQVSGDRSAARRLQQISPACGEALEADS